MWWTTVVVLAGCGAPIGESPADLAPPDALVFRDANNYRFSAEESFAEVEVEAEADFCVDWSGLTTDRAGRPVHPGAVDTVGLLELDLPQAELVDGLASDTLTQASGSSVWSFEARDGASSACASGFEVIGTPLDPEEPGVLDEDPAQSWFLWLWDAEVGTRAGVIVVPRESSTNHEVVITDESDTLTVTEVDLAGRPPLEGRTGQPMAADWSEVTVDVNGQPFDSLLGDRLVVARFDGVTVEEVEERVLAIETWATESWTLDVFGETRADLGEALAEDGSPFPGFTAAGTWVIGISCSACWSPAPLLLGVVEVAP